MFKYIFPTILTAFAIVIFFTYVKPTYAEIGQLRMKKAQYEEALVNAKRLDAAKNDLSEKYNAISEENRTKLLHLMPDTVDNVHLILDIQSIAAGYNMLPQDIKFEVPKKAGATTQPGNKSQKLYNTFDLEFSVTGNYDKFNAFLNDLESSLRIMDVTSITFSSDKLTLVNGNYKFTVKVRTYWLNN